MLIVMEDRNLHALTQLLLDVEAFRCFDVFKIDAAEGGLQRSNMLNQFVRIGLIHLDIEAIDTGEFFEQYGFAFHHRLGGERPDIAQTQHRRAVGDYADQIATRGHVVRLSRVAHDLFTSERDARRIRQRQITLVGHGFRRGNFKLAGTRVAVVLECRFFESLRYLGAIAHEFLLAFVS